jgi:uncharacterized protein (TIGR03086 family)
MDMREAYRRALAGFGARVTAVGEQQWHDPTPCAGWDVRALVNHLVNENRWVPELLAGKTAAEIGDAFDGDLLGDDPVTAFESSAAAAVAAASGEDVLTRTTHLSFGDVPGGEYLSQVFADALIHSWDLARATGADERLDPELVEVCAGWFSAREDAYRQAGAVGPRPPVPEGAEAQTRLLAAWGRRAGPP